MKCLYVLHVTCARVCVCSCSVHVYVYVMYVCAPRDVCLQGLKPGDQIMEINGHEVIGASLEEVLSRIQSCQQRLSMVVIPGPVNPTLVSVVS